MKIEDIELLRLAYKVAFKGELLEDKDMAKHWNPLHNDGDAFRLAVQLGLIPYQLDHEVEVLHNNRNNFSVVELYRNCPYTATRRAIVRAAAAIARQLDEESS